MILFLILLFDYKLNYVSLSGFSVAMLSSECAMTQRKNAAFFLFLFS